MKWTLKLAALAALTFLVPQYAQAKSASTIFTADMVANARENIRKYDWAQTYRDGVLQYANYWLGISDEDIWALPVEQTVPRAMYVHPTLGCPIHGKAVGMYDWKVDPQKKPFKVQCPIGGESWPTNNFAKFYKSGKDGHNLFNAASANRSLLYSEDSSRNYGVDDGNGYVSASGDRYDFIAYYNHWGVWQNMGRSWNQALMNLAEAYVLTGNAAYAHKAAILLSRIADLVPSMDTSIWSAKGFIEGDGSSGMGVFLGQIWDAPLVSSIARSYDAIFPALNNDTELYRFLSNKASTYGLTMVNSPAAFEKHIETNALTVLLQAIQSRRIRANEGIHQSAYADAAIALDDKQATPRWLAWLFEPGTVYEGGGHLPAIFEGWIDRDGASNESSLGYNAIWLDALAPLANLLQDSPYAQNASLERYPNFRNFLSFPYWTQITENYYPHIGDEAAAGDPGQAPGTEAARYAAAYQRYGYPELAQMAHALNGNSSAGLHGSIYDPGAAATAKAIDKVIKKSGRLERGPLVLTGYGLSTLTATAGGQEASVWLYGGRQNKHGHWDRLNLGMFAYGLDLLPDLGYPDFPTVDSYNYWGFQNNTVAHNTVVVNARRQDTVHSAATQVHLAETPVQVVETEGNGVYNSQGANRYHRTVMKVPTEKGFYLVDLFRVNGGGDHLYSFHAGPGAVATNGLVLTDKIGTYAGENVALGSFYDGACCTAYMGSGFQFLDGVSQDAAPAGDFQAEWSVVDNWKTLPGAQDTRLRLWSVSDKPSSVSLANGHPPANKKGNPPAIRYLLERRIGAAPLQSTFVHVIEPSVAAGREVIKVERFTPSPAADTEGFQRVGLKITLSNGRIDTVLHSLVPDEFGGQGISINGRGAVISRQGGKLISSYLLAGKSAGVGGKTVAKGDGIWRGAVKSINTKDTNDVKLTVTPAPPAGEWEGRHVRIAHPDGADPFYTITEVESKKSGTAIIHLGRVNLTRGHVDLADYTKGLLWDVAVGDAFEVQSDVYAGPASPQKKKSKLAAPSESNKKNGFKTYLTSMLMLNGFWFAGSCNAGGGGGGWMLTLLLPWLIYRKRKA